MNGPREITASAVVALIGGGLFVLSGRLLAAAIGVMLFGIFQKSPGVRFHSSDPDFRQGKEIIDRYNNTPRVASRLMPLHEAEIAKEVEMRTMDVLMAKDPLVAPAGTNTVEGTLAAPLLLESPTMAPPAGAARVTVTVPIEDCTLPTTLEGLSVSAPRVGGRRGTGVTVSDADRVALL